MSDHPVTVRTPAGIPLDTRPLTDPIDRAAMRKRVRTPPSIIVLLVLLALMGIGMVGGVVYVGVDATVSTIEEVRAGRASVGSVAGSLALLAFVVAAIVGSIALVVRAIGDSARIGYRLDGFARANDLHYRPREVDPRLPGMVLSIGTSRRASDVISGERPRHFEVGNHRYMTGTGKNRQEHRWGYVAVRLDAPLPNIVLDAKSNNGLFGASNLPATLARSQRLGLEGDFDRHFTLYCPTGYERDALYLFTPDIMARFIDNAAALDVEIVDDWLFLYSRRKLSTLDPAMWEWLFTTIRAVTEKIEQWGRWRDGRLVGEVSATTSHAPMTPPPIGVARRGRRLKRGVPVATALAVCALAVAWFWALTQR